MWQGNGQSESKQVINSSLKLFIVVFYTIAVCTLELQRGILTSFGFKNHSR